MTHFHREFEYVRGLERDAAPAVSGHPDDILNDPSLTTQQKRAVLASWASDANAVPHLPTLRQLPDGSVVKVDDILHALKVLDGSVDLSQEQANLTSLVWRQFKRLPHKWPRRTRRPGDGPDDDDPPPAPAVAGFRPKSGGGAVAFACAQPVAA